MQTRKTGMPCPLWGGTHTRLDPAAFPPASDLSDGPSTGPGTAEPRRDRTRAHGDCRSAVAVNVTTALLDLFQVRRKPSRIEANELEQQLTVPEELDAWGDLGGRRRS